MQRARRLLWTSLLIVVQAVAPAHALARAGQSLLWGEVCTAGGVQSRAANAPSGPSGISHGHDHCPGCPLGSFEFGPPAQTAGIATGAFTRTPIGHFTPCVPAGARSGPWARGPPACAAAA